MAKLSSIWNALSKSCLPSQSGFGFSLTIYRIRVEGYGTGEPSDLVAFPGTYSPNDPGILINIYDDYGSPNNRGQPYQIPGPRVISCSE